MAAEEAGTDPLPGLFSLSVDAAFKRPKPTPSQTRKWALFGVLTRMIKQASRLTTAIKTREVLPQRPRSVAETDVNCP